MALLRRCEGLLFQSEPTLRKVAGDAAMGSANELDHHLLLCKDLGFLQDEDYRRNVRNLIEVRKMLSALLDSIEEELALKTKAVAKG